MQPEKLLEIVRTLDNHIPVSETKFSQIVKKMQPLDFSGYDQTDLVNACNLFFAKHFSDNLAIANKMTPPVIGDLMALVASELGLSGQFIIDPQADFPDLIFQFASHFQRPIFAESADEGVLSALLNLAQIYRFDFTPAESNASKLIVSRLLGIDFAKELDSLIYLSQFQPGQAAIILADNVDLQSGVLPLMLKSHPELELLSIIKLPNGLFKHAEMASSLLILRRKVDNEKVVARILLAQIPELSNKEDFSKFVSQLKTWKKENL
ncbi:MAG: DNA methyltransferase [Oenococcus sp.]|uniref:DNA methyltransferase n=1 Tax=Oenococcus TaxID=46254 RepID=UPI0021E81E1A|nr:DNA methyltransferase [Oenococcus kitaharae]MCV3296068.1 DNA methyltransferase [Oenococcus kitaharae]